MESIGEIVKGKRAERGLTLSEAHEATKITMQNLAAIEEDRFDAFPNRVYARAFLRDYANYLGLDSSSLLERYEQEWGTPMPVEPPRRKSRAIPFALGTIGVLAVVAIGVYLYTTYVPIPKQAVRPTVTSPAPAPRPAPAPPAPTPKPTPAPTVAKPGTPVVSTASHGAESTSSAGPLVTPTGSNAPAKPTAPTQPSATKPTPPAPQPNKVTLTLKATKSSAWVSVKQDGQKPIQKTLTPGSEATFQADRKITLRVGNAGALDVTANGKHIGALGAAGQVVNRTFNKEH